MNGFNARATALADAASSSILTAYCFVAFSAIPAIVPSLMGVILYVSNTVQLVALPLLGVSNAAQAAATRREMREMHAVTLEILAAQREMVADLHAKHDALRISLEEKGEPPPEEGRRAGAAAR